MASCWLHSLISCGMPARPSVRRQGSACTAPGPKECGASCCSLARDVHWDVGRLPSASPGAASQPRVCQLPCSQAGSWWLSHCAQATVGVGIRASGSGPLTLTGRARWLVSSAERQLPPALLADQRARPYRVSVVQILTPGSRHPQLRARPLVPLGPGPGAPCALRRKTHEDDAFWLC